MPFVGIPLPSGCWTLSCSAAVTLRRKAELPAVCANGDIRQKGRTHKCTSHCAMGRDVSTLVVLEGCSGICTMDIFAQEGQAQLLSSFWTEKLRTSHVQS